MKASFIIKAAFQVTGRSFFVTGEILSGAVKVGMKADLRAVGILKALEIESIEFALNREHDKISEDVAFGISNLTDAEKLHLKANSPFSNPIIIV